MTAYDPKIIVKFADRLYARASSIVFTYTFLGIVLGGAGGYLLGTELRQFGTAAPIGGALLFGLLGFVIGQNRAFQLRLQAQIALCQVAIEANTRSKEPTTTP